MKKCKRSKMVMFLFAIVFIAATVNNGWADTATYKNYGRLALGLNQPTGDLDDEGYDEGINLSATYGRYLLKGLAVEGSVGSFFAEQEFSGRTALTSSYSREDTLGATFIMGTIKGEIPIGPVALYAGGGVGVYLVFLDSEIDTAILGELDADDSDTVYGAHVVVGGQFNITPRVFVGMEGLYRWTTEYDLRDSVGTIPVALESDLEGFTISFMGGFKF